MFYNKNNINLAKTMRSNLTEAELKLWLLLKAKKFYGYKFKRQVLIGNYIVDFLCPEAHLIVEVDGGQHNTDLNIELDAQRTFYLEKEGFRVLRFWNNEVLENIEGVCQRLREVLEEEGVK